METSRLRPGFALLRLIAAISLAAVLLPVALRAQAQAPVPPAPKVAPPAPTPPAALPSARSLIDKHLAAIGGREALLSHSSTRATGTFSVPSSGMIGALELFAAKPNKSIVRIKIAGLGEVVEAYDGKHAWTTSAMTGPMLLEGKQLEDKKFDADYYQDLHEAGRYESMTTVELSEFDGRPCYKVRLVRKNAPEEFEFYDAKTGLKAGRIATRESPMGTITVTSIEADYKKFGNLLLATPVKVSMMGVQQIITIDSVEYDTVPPSVFEPPADIKALIK